MIIRSVLPLLTSLGVILGAPCALAVTYTATLLNPAGLTSSYALGISGPTQAGSGYGSVTSFKGHALFWNGTFASALDLHPSGFTESRAQGVSWAAQVGFVFNPPSLIHAALWQGSADTFVDLNPSGSYESQAVAVSSGTQGGYYKATSTASSHAVLWQSTADTASDLNPPGYRGSEIAGISTTQQVGSAYGPYTDSYRHAFLWNGTADSATDLHPAGFTDSRAFGISDNSQVGIAKYWYSTATGQHAILWHGTAASAVDLQPAGYYESAAYGVSGSTQVGLAAGPATGPSPYGYYNFHAFIWSRTAGSAVDLHPYLNGLGPKFTESYARAISDNGVIVGFGRTSALRNYAVMWTPVPEPASCALLTGAFFFAFLMRGRRRLA